LVSHFFSDIFAQGADMQFKVPVFVLAGGEGARLYPLTRDCAKPAVPFGPKYRIVDFVLSNLINSGIYSIYVLVQFRSQSLLQHLSDGWQLGGVRRIWACPGPDRSCG
jgi:glucose-1-phosphate adenylyltransferase